MIASQPVLAAERRRLELDAPLGQIHLPHSSRPGRRCDLTVE
jgi:hypothetical protein